MLFYIVTYSFKYSCTKNFTAIPTRRGSKIEIHCSCNQNHTFAFLTHKKFTASFMPYRMKDLFCHPSEIIPRQICLDVYWCHHVFTCVLERENGIYPIYEMAGIVLFRFAVLSTLFGGRMEIQKIFSDQRRESRILS